MRSCDAGGVRLRLALATSLIAAAIVAPAALAAAPRVLAVHFDTDVNPVTQQWLNGQLARAERGHFSAVVILLDTPGGLEDSMRAIVQEELAVSAAGVPVIVYVTPGGARAASAGVWISEAADLLAMAPETNIGSSTPISSTGANIGSDLRRKVINDAAASLRGLATAHHRNAAWANDAVRVAANLTSAEALRMHVIDVLAPTLPALLREINGRSTLPNHLVLHTAGAMITEVSPGFLVGFLSGLLDPNIVSLLFLAGIVGLGFEIFHPGAILPGAFGAIALVLALFGLSALSISTTGLFLVLLAVVLLVLDAHAPTHGVLSLAGLLAMGFGLATLFPESGGPYHTSVPLIVVGTVLLGGAWSVAMAKGIAARRSPVRVGPEEIVGMQGVVRDDRLVFVHGELWRFSSAVPVAPGQRVEVDALEGLRLRVHPS